MTQEKEPLNTTETDEKKAENQAHSEKNPPRLKQAWEHLQRQQQTSRIMRRNNQNIGQISDVKIVKDNTGKETVQVNLTGGGKIMDSGDQRAAFQKMQPAKTISSSQINTLVSAVKELGFDAVAASLSPLMRSALLKACEKQGIFLKGEAYKKKTKELGKRRRDLQIKSAKTNNAKTRKEKKHPPLFSGRSMNARFNPSGLINKLNYEKRFEIVKNKTYLDFVLKRTEECAKEKYFDDIRKDLNGIEEDIIAGRPLTLKQKKSQEKALILGIQQDKKSERLTEQQLLDRREIQFRDLPAEVKREANEAKKRYKAICAAKNSALELAASLAAQQIYQGKRKEISAEELNAFVIKIIPNVENRTIENMQQSCNTSKAKAQIEKGKLLTIKQEKRLETAGKLAIAMEKTPKARKSHQMEQTTTRKSFINSELVQEIQNGKQTER